MPFKPAPYPSRAFVVLAQDRDRFAREPAYHYLLRKEFEGYGTKIRALNDRGDDSPEGVLTDGILDQLAKFERAKIAERTRRGKLRKAREGYVVASTPNYGFRLNDAKDGLVVCEPEMAVVERVVTLTTTTGATGAKTMAPAHVLARVSRSRRWSHRCGGSSLDYSKIPVRYWPASRP